MVKIIKERWDIAVLFAASLVFTLFHLHHCFFWDNIIQISVPAHWYYENNFADFFLPDEIATGHPPFIAMFVAFVWQIFGKSLAVTHLAFFPFVFGVAYQAYLLVLNITGKKSHAWIILLFILFDPTLLSQLSLISFDVVQTFFFLLALNSIVKNKDVLLSVAFLGLCLTSMRGIISAGGIFLFYIIYHFHTVKKNPARSILPFLPGVICTLLFFYFFYTNKHWIIHNTVSNRWEKSGELASLSEIFRNIGVFGWRLVDFGRIGTWLIFAYILLFAIKKKTPVDPTFKLLILITCTQFIVFFLLIIVYRNPFGHRYLIPVIIPATMATIYYVLNYMKHSILLLVCSLGCLIAGYFWVYPAKISMGWDATPAHWCYYKVRDDMIRHIESSGISIDSVGSSFPNTSPIRMLEVSEDTRKFKDWNLQTDRYILFSNVFNESNELIDELFSGNKWVPVKKIKKNHVYMILFQRKNIIKISEIRHIQLNPKD